MTIIYNTHSYLQFFLSSYKFFKENFNYSSDIFWLPDTFGYSAQLPQIIKIMGMKYFFTQKLSWNNINKVSLYIYNIYKYLYKSLSNSILNNL